MSVLGPNVSLVTNTTLVESARLLSGSTAPRIQDAGAQTIVTRRLIEFCNLAECIVLNESVFSLPGTLPEDVAGSLLLKGLNDASVHRTLASEEFARHVIPQARRMLGQIGNDEVYSEAIDKTYLQHVDWGFFGSPSRNVSPEDIIEKHNFRHQLYLLTRDPTLLDKDNYHLQMYLLRRNLNLTNPELGKKERHMTSDAPIDSISDYLNVLCSNLNYEVSPNTHYVIHQIRNVVYWSAAEHFGLSYCPDVLRIDWVRSWLSKWKSSLAAQLYSVIAKAFMSRADEVRRDEEGTVILLPPIPALIAQRAKERGNLVDALLDLRREFEGFRKSLADLEEERRHARSIADRHATTERIKKLFASVAKLSGTPQTMNLSTALGYTGKLLDVVKDPLSPKAYLSLAEKGADWIQDWWNARPAFRLLYIKRRLEALPHYWDLAKLIGGIEVSREHVEMFDKYYSGLGISEGDGPAREAV